MVRGSTVLLCLSMFVCLLATPVFADRLTEDLQSKIIERFDSPTGDKDESKYEYRQNHRWIVRGSKFITDGALKYSWVNTWPNALFPNATETEDLRSLGIQAAFDRKGYNYLELVPVEDKDGDDGKPIEKTIPLPGRVKSLDFWVWGSNLKSYMEIQFKDFHGMVQTLRIGDLYFEGWKNMRVNLPSSIPQDAETSPRRRGLELVKILIWTYPSTIVTPFKIYIDQIKVLSDMFESPFDGSDLVNPKKVEDLWSKGVGTFEASPKEKTVAPQSGAAAPTSTTPADAGPSTK